MRRPLDRPLIIGHRGLKHPEHEGNTLPSFRAALEAGADGIECDVRLGEDGVLFCCHDTMIRDMPSESLSADQRKAAGLDDLFPVINLAAEYDAGVLIEVKSREAGERLLELMSPNPSHLIISFSDVVVCRAIDLGWPAVMLDGTSAEVLRDLTPKGALPGPSWQVAFALTGPELSNASVWTVDDLSVAELLGECLAITTNFPAQVLDLYGGG